ncbi:Protein PSF-1 a [Aphelenchoides avenae]|nr:Protein PSF-1 a [Aphelenchus avenae]
MSRDDDIVVVDVKNRNGKSDSKSDSRRRDDRNDRRDDRRDSRDRNSDRSRRDHREMFREPPPGARGRNGSGTTVVGLGAYGVSQGSGHAISHAAHGGGSHAKLSGAAFTEQELLVDIPKKKYTGRCRLFVGNLTPDVKEAELKELFAPHGDIAECYLSGKGFAFVRLDTRAHAEAAKEALDGTSLKNRQIRVRFAVHGATVRVKELAPIVSNEMLYHTFSAFGDVERAVHVVDEKGKPTGEGIIEFERKTSAQDAEGNVATHVPLTAELEDPKDDEDGLSERMLPRTNQLIRERELGPRFAAPHSFEHMYGLKWKELYELEKRRRAELDNELREARRRLEGDMEIAYEDYKAQCLREELERRQKELEQLEAARRERDRLRQSQMTSSADRREYC